ncbi:hypothetical protein Psed_0861 [Pseudonocardia dioxanivorans CB1190]|uniref:Uncharacterized protein n=1 Tax=Pseudonocardia dioxanivorans (strain ATCC 55486 / DSM 44775 / JCM 13855 / CB1190) TaxID=675635 RepID=F4CSE1_PSEUX|nr:hypothetical protein [Pseudonocardia dioxanivorans]AEA23115.1 hypothetical protein Psed_0861 [Pseudonocardia dioxanivorans CB1190]
MAIHFRFTTADGDTLQINPDPRKLTGAELIAVERNTGLGMVDLLEALKNPRGSAAAICALVWLARRRSGDFVRWPEFVEAFHPLTLGIEVVDDEAGTAEAEVEPAVEG